MSFSGPLKCMLASMFAHVSTCVYIYKTDYGVATISRLLKITGLFFRISSLVWGSFAKRPTILRSLLIIATPYLLILRVHPFQSGHRYMNMYIQLYLHIYMHMYIYTYICTFSCTLVCMYVICVHVSTIIYTYLSDYLLFFEDNPLQGDKE